MGLILDGNRFAVLTDILGDEDHLGDMDFKVAGTANVLEILFNLQTVYGDPRYRPSPWLRRRGALGLSLTHEEI